MNQIIGVTELISIGKSYVNVPAKVDTGADRSAIWASNIRVNRAGELSFSLFGEGSKFYSGKIIKRKDFGAAKVKSSNGETEVRYRVHLSVTIAGKKIRATFYLSDRSNHRFPVLIGRRTIAHKFVVDVSKKAVKLQKPKTNKSGFRKNPYEFHKKYVKNVGRRKK